MLSGKVEGEMALLSEGSSVKESPEDKQASVPCVKGSAKISRWVTPARFTGQDREYPGQDRPLCSHAEVIIFISNQCTETITNNKVTETKLLIVYVAKK